MHDHLRTHPRQGMIEQQFFFCHGRPRFFDNYSIKVTQHRFE